MNHKTRRLLLIGMLLLAIAFALAACGKEEKASPTAAVAKPTTAAVAPAPTTAATKAPEATKPAAANSPIAQSSAYLDKHTAKLAQYLKKYHPNDPNNYKPERDVTPKYGGEIVGPFGTPANWDFIKDRGDSTHGPLIYAGFVRPAINRGDDVIVLKPKPDMMESWEQAKDGMSWTFKMQKGMKWQNKPPVNGRPITIQDMKYGLDLLRTEALIKNNYNEIQDVVVVDDQTLKVVLNKPFPDLVTTLMTMGSMIMPKECFESEDCRRNKPVGAGPFFLESMEPRVNIVFTKNTDYWGKDDRGNKLPYLDKVTTIVFADPAASFAAFRTGKIDNLYLYGEREFLDMQKTNPDMIVGVVGPANEYVMNGPQAHFKYRDDAPWKDPRVRKAMSMAMNRKAMIEDAHDGMAAALQPVPFSQQGIPFYPAVSEMGPAFQYNPQEAKKLLAEAGYAKGFKVKMEIVPISGTYWNALLIWQQNWKDVGIEMEIVPNSDSAAFSGRYMKNLFDDLLYQYSTNGPPWTRPSLAAYNTLHTKGTNNYEKINDPKLDELLDKARSTYDLNERAKVLRQVVDYEGENPHILYGVAPFRFELMSRRTHRMAGGADYQVWGWGMRSLIETWVDK